MRWRRSPGITGTLLEEGTYDLPFGPCTKADKKVRRPGYHIVGPGLFFYSLDNFSYSAILSSEFVNPIFKIDGI